MPFVPREFRVCATCGVLEDEEHVIYNCSLYDEIRLQFQGFLQSYPELTRVLNPVNTNDARDLGKFLNAIEQERKNLGLQPQ